MRQLLAFVYRLCTGALLGAQIFFTLVATRIVFSPEVAALPMTDPRRALAPILIGRMLSFLDVMSLVGCGAAVLCAVSLGGRARRAAISPLLAGLCAAASADLITPAIHGLRAAGQTASPQFGRLHALSSALLLLQMVLLLFAVWRSREIDTQAAA